MIKRFKYASLALLALSIPSAVLAQQPQPTPRRGDQAGASGGGVVAPSNRSRRTTPAKTATAPAPGGVSLDGIEGDVTEALTVIQDNYVDGVKLDYNNVFKSSIIGMLRSLDPHSNFYDAKEFEEQRADWRSEYYGIGATIGDRKVGGERTDTYILATFEDTPAYRAGLRFGDRIVEVDGQSMQGKASGEVRDRLRGPRGSSVKVTIERAATGAKETVEITRDAVSQPTVPDAYMIRPGVGYVDMQRGFNYTTADEFVEALERLRAKGMTSLVLDLRNNGGGILDQAVKVAEQFLPEGQPILTQKGRSRRSGGEHVYTSDNPNPDQSPVVVLVNRGTASASEIVAGALQDHDRALIIGETTFGKGLVQSIMPLDYGTALTLTTSKYYTPSGRLVQRDYSHTGFYDYIYRGGLGRQEDEEGTEKPAATQQPKGDKSYTDSGRVIYGGGGIEPDEAVKPRTISLPQQRFIDPVFAFAREVVSGRVAGFERYKVTRMPDFDHNLVPADFAVDDKLFKAFKEFVASKGQEYKLTEQQVDKQRDFVQRQLRYDMATAAYGTVKASQVLVSDDPQVAKGIDALPRAREMAASAQRGRAQQKPN